MNAINIIKILIFFLSLNALSQGQLSVLHTPVKGYEISSNYGLRKHPVTGEKRLHNGIDLTTKTGEFFIYNLLPGEVKQIRYDKNSGIYIKINHGLYQSIYAHLEHIYIKEGEQIQSGKIIGRMGATGRVTGRHLHFGIKKKGAYIDPRIILEIISETENQ